MKDSEFYGFELRAANGTTFSLKDKQEKAFLIVNTASKCGFTPQYKGLEALYREYGAKGLVVLGFPCDQFAHQEPGSDTQIAQFCEINFGVSFPLMSKIDVNGPAAHPLFVWLKQHSAGLLGDAIKWNFTKFLVWPHAEKVERFAPTTEPEKLRGSIEKALGM